MNTNTKRMVLAAIAAFYVVVGGLWASNYIPLKQFDAQMARKEKLIDKMGFSAALTPRNMKKQTPTYSTMS